MMRNAKQIDDQLYVDKTHFKKYDESWNEVFLKDVGDSDIVVGPEQVSIRQYGLNFYYPILEWGDIWKVVKVQYGLNSLKVVFIYEGYKNSV